MINQVHLFVLMLNFVIFCYVFSSCVYSSCWQVKKLFQVQFVDYTVVETDIVGKRCNEQGKYYVIITDLAISLVITRFG